MAAASTGLWDASPSRTWHTGCTLGCTQHPAPAPRSSPGPHTAPKVAWQLAAHSVASPIGSQAPSGCIRGHPAAPMGSPAPAVPRPARPAETWTPPRRFPTFNIVERWRWEAGTAPAAPHPVPPSSSRGWSRGKGGRTDAGCTPSPIWGDAEALDALPGMEGTPRMGHPLPRSDGSTVMLLVGARRRACIPREGLLPPALSF